MRPIKIFESETNKNIFHLNVAILTTSKEFTHSKWNRRGRRWRCWSSHVELGLRSGRNRRGQWPPRCQSLRRRWPRRSNEWRRRSWRRSCPNGLTCRNPRTGVRRDQDLSMMVNIWLNTGGENSLTRSQYMWSKWLRYVGNCLLPHPLQTFRAKVGWNLAFDLVTYCCSCQTACWRPGTCALVTLVNIIRVGVGVYKTLKPCW